MKPLLQRCLLIIECLCRQEYNDGRIEGKKLFGRVQTIRAVIASAGCQSGVLTSGLDGYAMRLVIGREC